MHNPIIDFCEVLRKPFFVGLEQLFCQLSVCCGNFQGLLVLAVKHQIVRTIFYTDTLFVKSNHYISIIYAIPALQINPFQAYTHKYR